MDERLTIILALKGRHNFTDRWLSYANINLSKFRILVADGSDKDEKYLFHKSKYPNLDITFKDFPADKDVSFYVRKLLISANIIQTKYILYADNDDFMVGEEIINLLNFLDKNDAYVAARGEIYDFSIDSFSEIYGKILGLKKFMKSLSFEKNDHLERYFDFSKNRQGLFHCIIRKDTFREILTLCENSKFFYLTIFKLFFSYYLVSTGKIFCSNNLYMLHQNHKQMLSKDRNLMNIKNSGFLEKDLFNCYFEILSQKLSNNNQNSKIIEQKIIKSFCTDFLIDKLNYYEELNSNQTLKMRILEVFKNTRIFSLYLKLKTLKNTKIKFKDIDNKNFLIIENFLKKS